MVMRGIFTLRRSELLFFYQDGSNHLFPDMYEPYANFIPKEERHDLMAAYHKRLIGDDEEIRLQAAKLWSRWEVGTSKLYIEEEQLARVEDAKVRLVLKLKRKVYLPILNSFYFHLSRIYSLL